MSSKYRYVVEYFAEGSDKMETTFVESTSKEAAKNLVIDKCGAFINIVACNKTKSSGGNGAEFQPEPVPVVVPVVDEVQDVIPEIVFDKSPPLVTLPESPILKTLTAETIAEVAPEVPATVAPEVPKSVESSAKTPRAMSAAVRTRAIIKMGIEQNWTKEQKVKAIALELDYTEKKAAGYLNYYSKQVHV